MFERITLTKIDAATRQYRAAVRMWFRDDDPVAIYTLAYASHEVAHTLHKKRGGKFGYVFDAPALTEQEQLKMTKGVRGWGNFMKHADRNPAGTIKFTPRFVEILLLATSSTLHSLTGKAEVEDVCLNLWMAKLVPEGYERVSGDEETREFVRQFQSKREFFDYVSANWGTTVKWGGKWIKAEGF
jgi:hypothetical protein